MDMIGRQLSRYRLLQEVGQGGMAVVYKATDTTLNREVAVKVLHPHLAGQEESRARLQREAHAVAKLRHENILEIFDYSGPDSAESYIVTEFIHGAHAQELPRRPSAAVPRGGRDDRLARWRARSSTRTSSASSTATSSPRTS